VGRTEKDVTDETSCRLEAGERLPTKWISTCCAVCCTVMSRVVVGVGERAGCSWLAAHDGEELVLVLGSLEDEREVEVRTCRTCGRDYTDLECPHCRERRIRLRGG
jgi:hypothetical protein